MGAWIIYYRSRCLDLLRSYSPRLEGTHAVTTSNPSPQAATAIDPRIKGIPPAAKEVPSQDIAHGREAVELCKRARALAGRIRDFQWAFEQKMSSTTQTDFQAVHEAKTDSDQQALWAKQATARKWAYDTHDKNFRETYVSEAKYLRDRLIDKLPRRRGCTTECKAWQSRLNFFEESALATRTK